MREHARKIALLLTVLGCLAVVATTRNAMAQVMGLGAPMTLRFVGTFQPYKEDAPRGLDTLTVTIDEKQFSFHVTGVQSYMGSDPSMMIIDHIFPPLLEFLGPKQRLDSLKNLAMGKKYAVEGWLYTGDNTFYVTGVRELPK